MNGARIPELAVYDSGRTGTVISDKMERYLEELGITGSQSVLRVVSQGVLRVVSSSSPA